MANKKTPQQPNTHRSAYDDFIHSDAFDAQYDYDSFYPAERSTRLRSMQSTNRHLRKEKQAK